MTDQNQVYWERNFKMISESIKAISNDIAKLKESVDKFILSTKLKLQEHDNRINKLEKNGDTQQERKYNIKIRIIDRLLWMGCAFAIGLVADHIHILKNLL
jgi:DNA-binding ferritin-like protein